jgi:hypothetical protein
MDFSLKNSFSTMKSSLPFVHARDDIRLVGAIAPYRGRRPTV